MAAVRCGRECAGCGGGGDLRGDRTDEVTARLQLVAADQCGARLRKTASGDLWGSAVAGGPLARANAPLRAGRVRCQLGDSVRSEMVATEAAWRRAAGRNRA